MDSRSPSKHSVFISFRGADTRENIVSFLHKSLNDRGIKTFEDNKLDRGEEILQGEIKSIQESLISIVIFSVNYAAAPWCLDELVQIMECKRKQNQMVVPVFYHVDRSDVENMGGSFGEALSYHFKYYKDRSKVSKWISALKEASMISGWDSNYTRPDSILIQEIINDISRKLRLGYFNNASSSRGMQQWEKGLEEHSKQLMLHNKAIEMHLEQEQQYLRAVTNHARMLEEIQKQRNP